MATIGAAFTCTPVEGPTTGGNLVAIDVAFDLFDQVPVLPKFDGVAATDVQVVTARQVTCRPPAHAAGWVSVTLERADPVQDVDVFALWKLDETSGTVAHDTGTLGLDLPLEGDAGFLPQGSLSTGEAFNGFVPADTSWNGGYSRGRAIALPTAPQAALLHEWLSNEWTWEGWCKPTINQFMNNVPFCYGGDSTEIRALLVLWYTSGSSRIWSIQNYEANQWSGFNANEDGRFDLGPWYCVQARRAKDPANPGKFIKSIWINGEKCREQGGFDQFVDPLDGFSLAIGAESRTSLLDASQFHGRHWHIRLSGKARSDAELAAYYRATTPPAGT